MYKTKLFSLASASAATGWLLGRENTQKPVEIKDDRLYLEYVSNLKQRGYVSTSFSSRFLEFHKSNMFTHAILTLNNQLTPKEILHNPQTKETITLFKLGRDLQTPEHFPTVCTTLFDECLARSAFENLPNKIGFTGTLEMGKIDKFPTMENAYIGISSFPAGHKGRRSESEGYMFLLNTNAKLASARVIMVEPIWAKYLSFLV